MKKLSSILLMALAATPSAQSDPGAFTGFYVGGNLGWTQRNDKTTFEELNVDQRIRGRNIKFEQNSVNKTSPSDGLNYGIYVGYGQNKGGFYWGGEFSISDDTANKGNTNDNLNFKGNGIRESESHGRLYTKYNRGTAFGLTPRVGVVIANENLLYAKLGMEYSHDKIIYQYKYMRYGNPCGHHKGIEVSRKKQIVFVPGVGYERAFGKMLARIEYGYNFGAKIQSPGLIKEANSDNYHCRSTLKYSAHMVKFGLAYKF